MKQRGQHIKINADGSMQNQTFSGPKYLGEYPTPNYNQESYAEYYERVNTLKEQGFHLGDLSWNDWNIYCKGHPYNEEYIQDETI